MSIHWSISSIVSGFDISWGDADGREVHNFSFTDEDGETKRYELPQEMIGEIMGLIAEADSVSHDVG